MAKPTPVRGLHAATPIPEAARSSLGGRLADVKRQLGKLGKELDAELVHDARVVRLNSEHAPKSTASACVARTRW